MRRAVPADQVQPGARAQTAIMVQMATVAAKALGATRLTEAIQTGVVRAMAATSMPVVVEIVMRAHAADVAGLAKVLS